MICHHVSPNSIRQLVHEFYDDIRADPDLSPIFNGAIGGDWQPHLDRMVDFWSTVMLGAHSFKGNVYGKHMLLRGVEPQHFVRWLGLFDTATARLFAPAVAAEFQNTARRIAESLKWGYFGSQNVEERVPGNEAD